jgi:IS5 family transposase
MEEMLIDGRIPDETTILNFRHLLEERQVADQILDVTIIHAPSSTKNKQAEHDPEMHSVAKGNQRFFGPRPLLSWSSKL